MKKIKKVRKSRFEPYKDIIIDVDCIKKKCTKCGEYKPAHSSFSKDYDREYGYNSHCLSCLNSYNEKNNQLRVLKMNKAENLRQCTCGRFFVFKENEATLSCCKKCKMGMFVDSPVEILEASKKCKNIYQIADQLGLSQKTIRNRIQLHNVKDQVVSNLIKEGVA